ncbi:hypothetical protein L1987_20272 [Smallanthus sonchifolius]|uniref:Uncharacterized protein n=1 Tax=Smallanthus sonchifolius TaxID=185202 RepID=A0ACB9ITF0_9ASTR|nr:hypothetical protein L1987_20272 [Smallanthus sonchifolius]
MGQSPMLLEWAGAAVKNNYDDDADSEALLSTLNAGIQPPTSPSDAAAMKLQKFYRVLFLLRLKRMAVSDDSLEVLAMSFHGFKVLSLFSLQLRSYFDA